MSSDHHILLLQMTCDSPNAIYIMKIVNMDLGIYIGECAERFCDTVLNVLQVNVLVLEPVNFSSDCLDFYRVKLC